MVGSRCIFNCSNISAEQFIGMSGSGFALGLAIHLMNGWLLTLLVVGKYFLPIFIEKGLYTIPEFIEKRSVLIKNYTCCILDTLLCLLTLQQFYF